MKILMIAKKVPTQALGGMEIHTMDLAVGLVRKGHEVDIITSRHPKKRDYEEVAGVRIHYTDCAGRTPLKERASDKAIELLHGGGYDIAHSQSIAAANMVKEGLFEHEGVPLVTTMHGTSLGEIKSILNQGITGYMIPRILIQLYNHMTVTNKILQSSDAVIAISRELEEKIPKEYHISADKVKTVFNGINDTRFKPMPSSVRNPSDGKKIVFAVSTLSKQKGIQHLIRALSLLAGQYPNLEVWVAGEGPFKSGLQKIAADLDVGQRVHFLGRIANKDLPGYYNGCDIFCIPTVRVEGLPLIELEAMACGKPVVASRIGGIPTVIQDGSNGLLFSPGDADELAKSIKVLLENEQIVKKLGLNARETIAKRFSRDIMVEETLKVYRQVMEG